MSDFIRDAVQAMLICALWSSVDFDGEPLDARYDVDDIDPTTVAKLREDFIIFIRAYQPIVDRLGMDAEQVGHDMWLTRNHHGAGIWDRGYGKDGEVLAEAMQAFGEVDLYVGDDGLIYA